MSARDTGLLTGASAAELRALIDGGQAGATGAGEDGLDLIAAAEERLGVDVVVLDIVGAGYSFVTGGRSVIVVDGEGAWFRENFTVAHELGHLASSSECLGQVRGVTDAERSANDFAAELLMPAARLRAVDWAALDDAALANLIWTWGVSTQALRFRLENLSLSVSETTAASLEESTYALLRRAWAVPDAERRIDARRVRAAQRRFPRTLVAGVRDAVAAGRAPAGSLAWLLGEENPGTYGDPADVNGAPHDLDVGLLDGLV